jgi:hypothetical protein
MTPWRSSMRTLIVAAVLIAWTAAPDRAETDRS